MPRSNTNSDYQEYQEQRARYARPLAGQSRTASRRSPKAPKEPVEMFRIDWEHATQWRTAQHEYEISQMEDKHLWETIIWLVRGAVVHFTTSEDAPADKPLELAAKQWLPKQTVFRALLQESIRRSFTFPDDVFLYIRQYVMQRGQNAIANYQPWQDPQAAGQSQDLEAFLNQPIEAPEDYGKEFRAIDLE